MHNDTTVDEYTTKATRILKQLSTQMPERYTAIELLQNMLSVDDSTTVRTPPEVTPAIRVEWQRRITNAQTQHQADPLGGHLRAITLANFIAYIRQQRNLNPTTVRGTHPVIRIDTKLSQQQRRREPHAHTTTDKFEECKFYSKNGWCRFKNKCHYTHNDGHRQRSTQADLHNTQQRPIRQHRANPRNNRSTTPHGGKHKHSHTEICRDYINRRCHQRQCPMRHIKLADLISHYHSSRISAVEASKDIYTTPSRNDNTNLQTDNGNDDNEVMKTRHTVTIDIIHDATAASTSLYMYLPHYQINLITPGALLCFIL
jgi:hypothetical protein